MTSTRSQATLYNQKKCSATNLSSPCAAQHTQFAAISFCRLLHNVAISRTHYCQLRMKCTHKIYIRTKMDKMHYCAGTETHCPKIHFSGGHYSRCMDSLWADVTPNKMPAAFVCSSAASFPKPAQRPG